MTVATEPNVPRIALAHDWLVGYRGGEAVLDAIAQAAASVGEVGAIYTLFDDGQPLTPAIDALPRVVWPIGRTRAGLRLRRWLLPVYPFGAAHLGRQLAKVSTGPDATIDLLVSTSSAAIHGVRAPVSPRTGRPVPHICYCHSPPRYLWHQHADYAGGVRGVALAALSPLLRAVDRRAAQAPPRRPGGVTRWIANSSHTRDRLREAYGVDAAVIHPPARTGFFTPRVPAPDSAPPGDASVARPEPVDAREQSHAGSASEGYFLYAGALEPYKRVDLAMNACAHLGARLVVVGTGSDEPRLRSLAADIGHTARIEFLGRVSDGRLRELYQKAWALVYPQCEDFGITAVEAQACGTPVVAYGRGGALDTVVHGRSGVHFAEQSIESLAAALHEVGRLRERAGQRELARACREQAERFGAARFMDAMEGEMRAALAAE